MEIEKLRSMMNYAIEAIGNGQFDLDASIPDRDDFGRDFQLYKGLKAGIDHFHDEFQDPYRDNVRKAYKALEADFPSTWVKSRICADLLQHVRSRNLKML